MHSVSLQELIKEFSLEILTNKVLIADKKLTHPEVNRPALQLAGFYDYFDADRIQLIGMVENTYLQKMEPFARERTLRKMFQHKIPCLVICRGIEPFPEMITYAEDCDIPVLSYNGTTTDFMGEIFRYLKVKLAPRKTLHGVLVDVYGEGLLIMGESGIGKSETALELVKRGHRLVADDAVEIKRVSQETLIGSCPEVIRYFIELRGVGIIDVRQMFGVQSIKATQAIDLVIKMEIWDSSKQYERLGLEEEYIEILGNKIICHSIPIRPGRNLAVICESAAINHRQKKMGYNAAKILNQRIIDNMNNLSKVE